MKYFDVANGLILILDRLFFIGKRGMTKKTDN